MIQFNEIKEWNLSQDFRKFKLIKKGQNLYSSHIPQMKFIYGTFMILLEPRHEKIGLSEVSHHIKTYKLAYTATQSNFGYRNQKYGTSYYYLSSGEQWC